MNKYTAFVVYTIFWQCLVWIGFGYVVFILDNPGWLLILALIMSSLQYQPRKFGIYGWGYYE